MIYQTLRVHIKFAFSLRKLKEDLTRTLVSQVCTHVHVRWLHIGKLSKFSPILINTYFHWLKCKHLMLQQMRFSLEEFFPSLHLLVSHQLVNQLYVICVEFLLPAPGGFSLPVVDSHCLWLNFISMLIQFSTPRLDIWLCQWK